MSSGRPKEVIEWLSLEQIYPNYPHNSLSGPTLFGRVPCKSCQQISDHRYPCLRECGIISLTKKRFYFQVGLTGRSSRNIVSRAVTIAGSKIKVLAELTMAKALRWRQAGGDLQSKDLNTANRVKKAAFPGNSQTRPEAHELKNGKMGEKHIHTKDEADDGPGRRINRKAVHHFIGSAIVGAAVGLEGVGKALESIGDGMEKVEQKLPRTMKLLDPMGTIMDEYYKPKCGDCKA